MIVFCKILKNKKDNVLSENSYWIFKITQSFGEKMQIGIEKMLILKCNFKSKQKKRLLILKVKLFLWIYANLYVILIVTKYIRSPSNFLLFSVLVFVFCFVLFFWILTISAANLNPFFFY